LISERKKKRGSIFSFPRRKAAKKGKKFTFWREPARRPLYISSEKKKKKISRPRGKEKETLIPHIPISAT